MDANHQITRELTEESLIFESVGSQILDMTDLARQDFELRHISGVVQCHAVTGTFSLNDDAPVKADGQRFTAREAANWQGEWAGYFYSESINTWMVMTDPNAMGHLHFGCFATSDGRRTVIASPFFRAVARSAERRNFRLSINWSTLLPFMLSTTNLYSSRMSDGTFAEEIQTLNGNTCLLVNDKGYGLAPRLDPLFPDEDPLSVDYSRLSVTEWVERGIAEAGKDLRAGLASGYAPNITLSGGKDSRSALAILAANGLEKEFKVLTQRPANTVGAVNEVLAKDLEIASKIVDKFGLDWHYMRTGQWRDREFDEVLDQWQRYRSNQYYEFVPGSQWRENAGEFTVGGGAGENNRTHYGVKLAKVYKAWWDRASNERDGITRDLQTLMMSTAGAWRMNAELMNHAAVEFSRGLQTGKAEDTTDFLPYVFWDRKMKCHQSNNRTSAAGGVLQALPVNRPEFIAAWSLLDRDDQARGKVAFEIVANGCPELLGLEYESGPWPAEWTNTVTTNYNWSDASVARATERYNEGFARNRHPQNFRSSMPPLLEPAQKRLNENMNILLNVAPQPDVLATRVALLAMRNKRALDHMLVVTESARDVLCPANGSVIERSYDVGNRNSRTTLALNSNNVGTVSFEKVMEELDVSGVTATVSETPSDAGRVFSITTDGLPDGCDVAFYLYTNGTMTQKQWYGESDRWTCEPIDPAVRIARFTVFLKWHSHPEACRIFDVPVTL